MSSMSSITVGIKTFMRPEKLQQCLNSLVGLGFSEVIVADDGEITPESKRIYDHFSKLLPLTVLELPFDSGLSYGRNQIVKECKTPYLLLLDDDQRVDKNIVKLLSVLEADPSLGGISGFWMEYGYLKCDAHNLVIRNGYLLKHLPQMPEEKKIGNLRYYICDQIPNSTLYRIECLRDQGWDEAYKIGREHVDFFLTHKKLGKWKFAVTPDVTIIHDPKGDTYYKERFRLNKERLRAFNEYFLRKWNLKGVIEGRKLLMPNETFVEKFLVRMVELNAPPYLVAFMQSFWKTAKDIFLRTALGKRIKKVYHERRYYEKH